MNLELAEAVIATFRKGEGAVHSSRLSLFKYHAWVGIYGWLDASGLALYFLYRLQILRIEAAIPARVLQRLMENAADNRKKTAQMFEEFLKINFEFKNAGLSYANLKGFTLAPDACIDIAMRCQLDLDFLVDSRDVERCDSILAKLGYSLTGISKDVREFKAGSERLPLLRDLYKTKSQRCVEVHSINDVQNDRLRDDKLSRSGFQTFHGAEFPVLASCDKFLEHTIHVLKHLRSEWTRASWVLEYANFVSFHKGNESLWLEVMQHTAKDRDVEIALGAVTLVAEQSFGIDSVPEVLRIAVRELPRHVQLWIEQYGKKAVLARYPGTKLYLLLGEVLSHDEGFSFRTKKQKLFPYHRPAKITVTKKNRSTWLWLHQEYADFAYLSFRFWFHLRQTCSYSIEAVRWKRIVSTERS